jgi:hypothetical protein
LIGVSQLSLCELTVIEPRVPAVLAPSGSQPAGPFGLFLSVTVPVMCMSFIFTTQCVRLISRQMIDQCAQYSDALALNADDATTSLPTFACSLHAAVGHIYELLASFILYITYIHTYIQK